MQDCEASKVVMAVPRSGGGTMGTRRHDTCQLFFLIRGGRYIFSHVILNDCCI